MNKVVKIFGSWCAPCQQFEPVFQSAANKTNVPFESWDVDELDKTWLSSLGVNSIPTLLFYRDGEVVRITGRIDERQILDTISEVYNGN